MKLRFEIQYATQWGESLHVVLGLKSQDGTHRHQNLMMQTQDGQSWVVETAAVESRQHPLESMTYFYQVEDAEGHVLRREWQQVKRTYHFDSSKNYVFADHWQDRPLCSHLYSSACAITRGLPVETSCDSSRLRVPLYRKTILFRVSAPQLEPGQSLALVGSHPALGMWSPSRYLPMEPLGHYEWMLSVNVAAIQLPLEYKYVVIDDKQHELVCWEEGDNRSTEGWEVNDGQVLVLHGDLLHLKERTWRAAGVVVPVFSLRSEHSFGVGDFGDLRRLVDWAVQTGMRVIQVLPVNDTTTDGQWHDSYPYNIVSCFALHPHYLDVEQLGPLKDKARMTAFRRQQRELNALPYSDYEAVGRVKKEYVTALFEERGKDTLSSTAYREWVEANRFWLEGYAKWLIRKADDGGNNGSEMKTAETCSLIYYIQYHLHMQLMAAADYARSHGVVLKGDLPIGVNRESAETVEHPHLFNLDMQTGAPPDAFSPIGQNWGFPTYSWSDDLKGKETVHASKEKLRLEDWFRRRMKWMAQYFDALRIDHVLGFFRIWEIPNHAIYAQLGHFSPSLPLTVGEIEYFGLSFRRDLFTKPFINDRILDRFFGIHAQYVRDTFLVRRSYGLYDLREGYETQRKVMDYFEGRGDENSLWIRDGLLRLIANVLFVEDPHQQEMYHPRISAYQEPVYDALSNEEKDAFMRLYNNYFYQRHDFFWGHHAIDRLESILDNTFMLACAEDLGMLPSCVSPVLDQLRILTLEIQSMPKLQGQEFAHLDGYPYRSVATFSTHDMAPLRLWWQESPERTQRYYVTMLQKQGRAPEQLPAHLAEEILARHLYCPSMLCVLSLQDWLAMDGELRSKRPRDERINVPSDPYNRWQWRMHITIEQLLSADCYNNKVRTMITRSRR